MRKTKRTVGLTEVDFRRFFPGKCWVSDWAHDRSYPGGYCYKLLTVQDVREQRVEMVLVLTQRDGQKEEMLRVFVCPREVEGAAKLIISDLTSRYRLDFQEQDYSRIRTLRGYLRATKRFGWSWTSPERTMPFRKPKKRLTGCTWLLYELTIQGSYAQNVERPATDVPDTFQYWITPSLAWDVRTFAIDRDIRVLRLEHAGRIPDPVAYFQGVAQETYGDIIRAHRRISATEDEPVDSLLEKVRAVGLYPHVEMTALGFPLWLPEDAKYYTQHEEQEEGNGADSQT